MRRWACTVLAAAIVMAGCADDKKDPVAGGGEVFVDGATTVASGSGASSTSVGSTAKSLREAAISLSDLPPDFEASDEVAGIGMAACAGAVERPQATRQDGVAVHFTGAAGTGIDENIERYSSGAGAMYDLFARSAADCRSRAGDPDGGVREATALDIGTIGDQRTAAAFKLGADDDPEDFVLFEVAVVRVDDVVITLNHSGKELTPELTKRLIQLTVTRLG